MPPRKAAAKSRKAAAAAKVEEPAEEEVPDQPTKEDEQPQEPEEHGEGVPELDDPPPGILDTVQGEIILLKALARHRPLGMNRHFEMAALLGAVNSALETSALEGGQVGIEGPEIWEKLKSMWDFERLSGDLTPPFPSPPLSPPIPPEPDLGAFHLPLNGSFDALVDARRLHSAGSRSPPTGSPARHQTLGKLNTGDSGSSLTGSEDEEDEEMAVAETVDAGETDEDEETEEEESEEELTPVKKRKKARRR